jgi:ABC-2 type transport system permease protein
MIRLIRVEMRRLLARRITAVGALFLLAMVVAVVGSMAGQAAPVSAQQRAQAEATHKQELQGLPQIIEDCRIAQAEARAAGDPKADFQCEAQRVLTVEELLDVTAPAQMLTTVLTSLAMLLVFVAFLVAASGTAAELGTGSMATWLTFVPRRGQVFASKAGAAVLVLVPVVIVTLVLAGGAVGALYTIRGTWQAPTSDELRSILALAGRLVGLGALSALAGACWGILTRSTAAAVGLFLGWTLIVENIIVALAAKVPGLTHAARWTLQTNISALVDGEGRYFIEQCTASGACSGTTYTFTAGAAGLYLTALAIGLALVTIVVFRRSDVT